MALSEKARSEIFHNLAPIVGDKATSEMLSYFPARDVEESVTKEYLRAEMSGLRLELHTEIDALRSEVRTEIGDLRSEMRTEIGDLRAEMHAAINRSMAWMIGTMIALAGVISGVVLAAH